MGVRCHACDHVIDVGPSDRIGFRDLCDRCGADLHVCLNCQYHDPSAYNECREPQAERVADRDRANRCDYFRPASGELASGTEADDPRAALEALFKKS